MRQGKLRILDLFSGIGGFSLGLERAGMKTVAFCEIDPFCRKVLRKHWPDVPIYEDIRGLNAERLQKDGIWPIDVICGGFPCQPNSLAGRKRGAADHRDLWPEMCRIIEETRPRWVIGENVANFANMAFTRTKLDLEGRGYEVWPLVIPACAIGALHRRDRVWIIAHAAGLRLETPGQKQQTKRASGKNWWRAEPGVCRVAYGVSNRVERLTALGNAVLPGIVETIGLCISVEQAGRRNV